MIDARQRRYVARRGLIRCIFSPIEADHCASFRATAEGRWAAPKSSLPTPPPPRSDEAPVAPLERTPGAFAEVMKGGDRDGAAVDPSATACEQGPAASTVGESPTDRRVVAADGSGALRCSRACAIHKGELTDERHWFRRELRLHAAELFARGSAVITKELQVCVRFPGR
ncbi:hypothetical protein GCM10010381_69600 [Streptomyces xantholiticus]|nr:hypothetical protein GCM10010381_69600 [Streptomyces xantholiticus]